MNKHASSPYNPNIAHVFYLAGFIESWGRGIEKICSACEKDGVPQPEYTINPGDIMIKFTAPEDRVIRVTERVTVKVTDEVTDKEQTVLSLLAEEPRLYHAAAGRTIGCQQENGSCPTEKAERSRSD